MSKAFFRKVCAPILGPFEKGGDPAGYRPSHRKILLVVGTLFALLASVSLYFVVQTGSWGASLPIFVFYAIALVSLVVGTLGSDGAVAKIWGNRR